MACVTDRQNPASAPTPLFRADIGEISGGVAPGPHAVWYVPAEPVRFVKIGAAGWADGSSQRGLFGRLFRTSRSDQVDAAPAAYVAAGMGLPTPSRVLVTNVTNGRTITVRVEGTARLSDAIIKLPAPAARELDADPSQPLLVRVRYLAPTMTYEGRAPLRYALRSRPPAPAASVRLAAEPPPPLTVAALDRPTAKPAPDLSLALRTPTLPTNDVGVDMVRVQAAAFANRANAERTAAALTPAGATTIVPLQLGKLTLYRVVVARPQAEGAADRLRAKVAQAGFPDAWILRSL